MSKIGTVGSQRDSFAVAAKMEVVTMTDMATVKLTDGNRDDDCTEDIVVYVDRTDEVEIMNHTSCCSFKKSENLSPWDRKHSET
jgi:hypothetical protein